MRYTKSAVQTLFQDHQKLEKRCSRVLCSVVRDHPKVIKLLRIDTVTCCGGALSFDREIWPDKEPCVVVSYLCEFPSHSLDAWKWFNIPLRWVQSDNAVDKGVREYKTKTADIQKQWERKHLDEQITAKEQELRILQNKRKAMEDK